MDDSQLLRQYVSTRSPQAFAALVRLHADLVYSAARRQMGHGESADDVTQAVFILLARKAPSIKSAPLAGWLVRATHFACRNAKKLIARRQFHERRAAEMKPEQIPPSQESMWESYAPLLDEALAGLRQKDRDAVALRFFQGLSLREVGAALGISEDAARMRVDRGIARLRQAMTSKATVPAVAVLATQLAARGSEAAPAHLVQSITATAATTTAKGTFAGAIARKASRTMTWVKIKVAAAMIAAIGVAGAGAGVLVTVVSGASQPQSTTQPSPATQKSDTKIHADNNILLQKIQVDKTALLKDELELERVTEVDSLQEIGRFKIDGLLNARLQDGMLNVDPTALISAVHGRERIQVEGLRHVPASQPSWTAYVEMEVGDPQKYIDLYRYDWDQTAAGQFYSVTFRTFPDGISVSGSGNGIDVSYVQNGSGADLSVSHTDVKISNNWGVENSSMIEIRLPNLLELQAERPEEVRKYLAPLLERLTDKNLLRLGSTEVYSVFRDIPADPKATQAVIALLPRLDADARAERDAASADLAKLGAPGVLAILRLDRSTLTQEQKSRCDAFVQSERNRTIDDPRNALHDASFLLEAADDDDLAVRIAAKKALEALVGHPVAFDPALVGEARSAALDKIHHAVFKNAAVETVPASQPGMDRKGSVQ